MSRGGRRSSLLKDDVRVLRQAQHQPGADLDAGIEANALAGLAVAFGGFQDVLAPRHVLEQGFQLAARPAGQFLLGFVVIQQVLTGGASVLQVNAKEFELGSFKSFSLIDMVGALLYEFSQRRFLQAPRLISVWLVPKKSMVEDWRNKDNAGSVQLLDL